MSDDMTLMIPETMVNDLFQCTAARMDGDIIKLIKGQKTCEIDIKKIGFGQMTDGQRPG